tara:strand:- start:5 stop:1048 length:1044 start_codon:yes stop_codon:yes gene_type:complete
MINYKNLIIKENQTIEEALKKINENGINFIMVISKEDKLSGVLTDGDLRRQFLKGINIKEKVSIVINKNFIFINENSDDYKIKNIFDTNDIEYLPVIDSNRKIKNLLKRKDFKKDLIMKTPVIIMAGGLGTRLGAATASCPKPMIKIHGKPILEIVLENCISYGLKTFYISVNFLKDQIINYFEDGSKWGVNISYLQEEERLGTAGSLSLLPDHVDSPIFITNCDVLTKCDLGSVIYSHLTNKSIATIVTKQYETNIPFGVIKTDGDLVLSFEEKPNYIYNVNTGLYVINPEIYKLVPSKKYFDMPDLLQSAMKKNYKINIFSTKNYWLDIGHPETLIKAKEEWDLS